MSNFEITLVVMLVLIWIALIRLLYHIKHIPLIMERMVDMFNMMTEVDKRMSLIAERMISLRDMMQDINTTYCRLMESVKISVENNGITVSGKYKKN